VKKYLHQFGGHKYAAGVKSEKSKLKSIKVQLFEKTVKETVDGNMFERKHSV
jgi:nanoRNase/pAp phosphatase (c-di-AMP/oligoRNAs hydrolase)